MSRTSLHAVQYNWQAGYVPMICSCYFKNGQSRDFVMFCVTASQDASQALFLACSYFFAKIEAFVPIKLLLNKKGVYICYIGKLVLNLEGISTFCLAASSNEESGKNIWFGIVVFLFLSSYVNLMVKGTGIEQRLGDQKVVLIKMDQLQTYK